MLRLKNLHIFVSKKKKKTRLPFIYNYVMVLLVFKCCEKDVRRRDMAEEAAAKDGNCNSWFKTAFQLLAQVQTTYTNLFLDLAHRYYDSTFACIK